MPPMARTKNAYWVDFCYMFLRRSHLNLFVKKKITPRSNFFSGVGKAGPTKAAPIVLV